MVTKETRHILLELQLYLISKGKNQDEIDEVMDELTTHAVEAEKDGKTGKMYLEEIHGALLMSWRKSFLEIIKTGFRLSVLFNWISFYMMLADAISQSLSYSWYALIGYPLIIVANVIMTIVMFRASAFQTSRRAFFYFWILGVFQMTALITVKLLDQKLGTPLLVLTSSQRWGVILLLLLCIILLNAILKANMVSLIPLIFFGPQLLFEWLGWTSPLMLLFTSLVSIVILILLTIAFYGKQTRKMNI
ncbi:hypothetical protein OE903_08630 [Bacillus sp. B6(2022)]|nr:hypothetical protein [Bacillus sp. B6(2022)]